MRSILLKKSTKTIYYLVSVLRQSLQNCFTKLYNWFIKLVQHAVTIRLQFWPIWCKTITSDLSHVTFPALSFMPLMQAYTLTLCLLCLLFIIAL